MTLIMIYADNEHFFFKKKKKNSKYFKKCVQLIFNDFLEFSLRVYNDRSKLLTINARALGIPIAMFKLHQAMKVIYRPRR